MGEFATVKPSMVEVALKVADGDNGSADLMQTMMEDTARAAGIAILTELATSERLGDMNHVAVTTGMAYALGAIMARNFQAFKSLAVEGGREHMLDMIIHMMMVGEMELPDDPVAS